MSDNKPGSPSFNIVVMNGDHHHGLSLAVRKDAEGQTFLRRLQEERVVMLGAGQVVTIGTDPERSVIVLPGAYEGADFPLLSFDDESVAYLCFTDQMTGEVGLQGCIRTLDQIMPHASRVSISDSDSVYIYRLGTSKDLEVCITICGITTVFVSVCPADARVTPQDFPSGMVLPRRKEDPTPTSAATTSTGEAPAQT